MKLLRILCLLGMASALLAGATIRVTEVYLTKHDEHATDNDSVGLNLEIDPAPDKLEIAQLHIRDVQTGRELKISFVEKAVDDFKVVLDPSERIEDKQLLVITVDPVFKANPLPIEVGKTDGTKAAAGAKSALQKADSKDDSRFYFDGEISHTRGQDVVGTYDLKLAFLRRRLMGGLVVHQGPLYTLTGGNDPKGDPDSMQLAWTFNVALPMSAGPFLALAWENTPKIESTRDFTYTNFVYSTRFKLVSRAWTPASGTRFYVRPYIGGDVGRNLASEVAAARDQTILRPVAGSTLTFVIGLGGEAAFNIAGDYIRYWPINNEVLITTDKSGAILTPSVGTKARDHIKAGTGIDFNKWASVKVAYERGSLPPAFKFVDNKVTLSLVIKAK